MYPEFDFQESWEGWQSLRSPDNIFFKIWLSDNRISEVSASLIDLVELHEGIHSEEEFDLVFGTGSIITVRERHGKIELRLDEEYRTITTYEYLKGAIDKLLQEIFSELEGTPSQIPDYQREEYPEVEQLYNDLLDGC